MPHKWRQVCGLKVWVSDQGRVIEERSDGFHIFAAEADYLTHQTPVETKTTLETAKRAAEAI